MFDLSELKVPYLCNYWMEIVELTTWITLLFSYVAIKVAICNIFLFFATANFYTHSKCHFLTECKSECDLREYYYNYGKCCNGNCIKCVMPLKDVIVYWLPAFSLADFNEICVLNVLSHHHSAQNASVLNSLFHIDGQSSSWVVTLVISPIVQ